MTPGPHAQRKKAGIPELGGQLLPPEMYSWMSYLDEYRLDLKALVHYSQNNHNRSMLIPPGESSYKPGGIAKIVFQGGK